MEVQVYSENFIGLKFSSFERSLNQKELQKGVEVKYERSIMG
jgi:hypothetical protein